MPFSVDSTVQTFALPHSIAEGVFIAQSIQKLVKTGLAYHEIAVISRAHKDLESIVQILQHYKIPVNYERKKNVLEVQQVIELNTMLRFVVSLTSPNTPPADELLPQILRYAFWQLPASDVHKISLHAYSNRISWLESMQQADQILHILQPKKIQNIAQFFLQLSLIAVRDPAERMFDLLMGVTTPLADDEFEDEGDLKPADNANISPAALDSSGFFSPFKQFYFDSKISSFDVNYLEMLSAISVMISAVRDFRAHRLVTSSDIIQYLDTLQQHGKPLLDTTTFGSAGNAVNILTAHKSKGLEFDTVFIARANEKCWFGKGFGQKLGHPSNLQLSPEADTIDDKLRLFFVAVTRAKNRLVISFPQFSVDGKSLNPVPVISNAIEIVENDHFSAEELAHFASIVVRTDNASASLVSEVLAPVLQKYQLPVTHLINFIDLEKGGPQLFLQHNLLRFPQAKTNSSAYGTAMHAALKWWHNWQRKNPQSTVEFEELSNQFSRILGLQRLLKKDFDQHVEKGIEALKFYYTKQNGLVDPLAVIEKNFKSSGSVIGTNEAKLTGQIDKMYVNSLTKTISVIDFKTGKPLTNWSNSDSKSWKYDMQLAFYKILIENSREYSTYTVTEGALEFLDSGVIGNHSQVEILAKSVSPAEIEYLTALIDAVWLKIQQIMSPDPQIAAKALPDISNYDRTLKGSQNFADDLIAGRV